MTARTDRRRRCRQGGRQAKEASGTATGNEDLAREGRLQQAQGEAEREAQQRGCGGRAAREQAQLADERTETELERERLRSEVAATQREQQAAARPRRRPSRRPQASAAQQQAAAEAQQREEQPAAQRSEEQAEQARLAAAQEEIRLQREARAAEERADRIDPEEDR